MIYRLKVVIFKGFLCIWVFFKEIFCFCRIAYDEGFIHFAVETGLCSFGYSI